MLLDKGVPMPVERALIAPPRSRMGAITPEERAAVRARSPVGGKYDAAINRESAYEMLNERVADAAAPADPAKGKAPAPAGKPAGEPPSKMHDFLWGTKRRQGVVEAAAKSATRTVASGVGRSIVRGVLGSIFGGRKR
jgi:DNA helicase HerA-like ATPase